MGRKKLGDADEQFRIEVSQKFRAAMNQRGLSQAAAARELGVTRQAIWLYLHKLSTPHGEILARACAKWGITLRYRNVDFAKGAFAAKENKSAPEVLQMDLFREPLRFSNEDVEVTLTRSHRSTLQVSIRMKKAPLRAKSAAAKAV